MWQFDLITTSVVPSSQVSISVAFNGVPNGIGSALLYDSRTVYFFKDLK